MSTGPLANNADKRSFPGVRQLPICVNIRLGVCEENWSGTTFSRHIISSHYVDAHGQLPDAPSDRWSLDQKEYFIIHSAVQILLNIHSFWPFPTCEFIGGEISL
jgi:hypothetical protein